MDTMKVVGNNFMFFLRENSFSVGICFCGVSGKLIFCRKARFYDFDEKLDFEVPAKFNFLWKLWLLREN